MTEEETPSSPPRRRPVFAPLVAIGMLLMGAYGAVRGMPWPLSLGLGACGVMVLMALGRPLYKAAVYRTGAREILCRYIPWYQAVPLASSVIFPIIGIAAIGMGNESDSPSWLLFAGYFLLILGLVFAASALLAWIANRLVLTPTSVGLKIIFRGRQEIPRENVRAITATMGRNGATGAPRLHVEFTYAPADGTGDATATVGLLEGQFSVDPANLAAGLQAWKDGDPNDPGLMDRVEAILREP